MPLVIGSKTAEIALQQAISAVLFADAVGVIVFGEFYDDVRRDM